MRLPPDTLTFDQVKKQFIRKIMKKPELQGIGQAIEENKHWDYQASKPTRQVSNIDIFDRVREVEGNPGRLVPVENPELKEEKTSGTRRPRHGVQDRDQPME